MSHPSFARSARSDRGLAWLLAMGGVAGLVASFVLVLEKIALLKDASYLPSCSLNPVLNCGSIMKTQQAELLGFPNPLIGLLAFPVLVATGAALLGGARLARWYWLGLQIASTMALGLVAWLIFQSLYRIGALCPYCMVVWVVVIPIFWYITLRNLSGGVMGERLARSGVVGGVRDSHALVLTITYLVVVGLIAQRFWSYWSTLL